LSQYITLAVKDAPQMQAYVATPAEGADPFPAIIVLQEAFGVNHHIRDVAERFAKEGYVAIAPELFHRTAPPRFEVAYTNFAAVQPHFAAITPENMQNDLDAVFGWLLQQSHVQKDNVASIGFCMGGRISFLANSILPLKAAISFYGGNMHSLADRAAQLHAPHLFFWGGKDQHIKPEHIHQVISALQENGKIFTNVEFSYADHGFFCNERTSYNAEAAQEAWAMVKMFLKNKLRPNS
jgi:carboxymethylenebutenolidase